MSQPLPYQLHLHALRDKERYAGVAQGVEADVFEAVLPYPFTISKAYFRKI